MPMEGLSTPCVAIVDFGGQYAHLIARRVRGLGLFSRIVQPSQWSDLVRARSTGRGEELVALILSGGPRSVLEPGAPRLEGDVRESPVPVLGICYGHQYLAHALGGTLSGGHAREYGLAMIECLGTSSLFAGLPARQRVWVSHGDTVVSMPEGYRVTASTEEVPVAAFESPEGKWFGLQFHPEVSHTAHGRAMLDNFFKSAKAPRSWHPGDRVAALEARIKEETGGRTAVILVSGGVDSLVASALCIRALPGKQIQCIHVDTGLMRAGESDEVITCLEAEGLPGVRRINARERFLKALAGIIDPERKRAVIGRLFVEEISDILAGQGQDRVLVQGTIYPDTIESGGTAHAAKIKTHHNRVPEIEALIASGRVVEPLRDLYKDEIRDVGRALGLPEALILRHPFPGPGLAVRLLCSDGREPPRYLDEEGQVKAMAASIGCDGTVLPLYSVGVQGDERTYRHPAVIWSADGSVPPWEALLSCAARMVNSMKSISRVVFAPLPYRHAAFCLSPTTIDEEHLERLRAVDARCNDALRGEGELWQMPVVGLPLYDEMGRQVFVMRPVCSQDAMTCDVFRMNPLGLLSLVDDLEAIEGFGALLYDVTTKPPGTIEWE
ncbi:MAG: glutamine-hydrolyzing GMP synthase [Candidatus Eremiobacteraeota bacterium]|nr:glutamine-hydrolyzing GMP synthase [Candidatus Eremiobacteraeota bacterium]